MDRSSENDIQVLNHSFPAKKNCYVLFSFSFYSFLFPWKFYKISVKISAKLIRTKLSILNFFFYYYYTADSLPVIRIYALKSSALRK